MKKLFIGMAVAALTFGVVTPTVSVFAATDGSKDVPVIYDNRNVIPDPDNPSMPAWGVEVPTAIVFEKVGEYVNATVTLVGMNGMSDRELGSLMPDLEVTVWAKSKNAADSLVGNGKTVLDGGDAKLNYTLMYSPENKLMTVNGDKNIVAILKSYNETVRQGAGLATLDEEALKTGVFVDTVTYTIQRTK